MIYKNLGHSPLKVSRICLGTMMFADQTNMAEARSIVDHAKENGCNFIDTADVYNAGRSEEIVGEAIAQALGSPALVWAVLLLWLADEKSLPLDRHARRLLEVELANVDSSAKTRLITGLEGAMSSRGEDKAA